jgi:hypothetical protein
VSRKVRLIFLILGLSFFFYLVKNLGIDNILANIVRTGWWFAPIIFTWGIVYLLNAISWSIVMGKDKNGITFGELFRASLSSFAINYVTPFISLGGEPFRVMSVSDRIGTERAISSVFLYRLLHSTGHLLFLFTAVVIGAFFIPEAANLRPYLVLIAAFLVILIGLLFAAQRYGIFGLFFKFARKIPVLRGLIGAVGAGQDIVGRIDANTRELFSRRKSAFFAAVSIELFSRFLASIEFFFILHAIDLKIPLHDAFYLSAASSLILTMLFFVPFELGTREGSFYLLMQSLHLDPVTGIYVGLATRIREIFWIFVGLSFIYFSGRRRKRLEPDITASAIKRPIVQRGA